MPPEDRQHGAPPYATLRRRMGAGVVDLALSAVVVVPAMLALGGGGFVGGMALVIALFALAEARGGQTPGKRLAGIRVLLLDGSPCTGVAAVLRNAFRVLDAFPGCYLVGVVSIAGSRRRQRIGDQAAGTSVFRDAAR